MKLATFDAGQGPRAGIVAGERVHDVSGLAPGAPASVKALIAAWDAWKGPLTAALPGSAGVALSSVKLMAPVPDPQKVLAIGLNYADHIAESGAKTPEKQIWFPKMPTSVAGPHDPIPLPRVSEGVDYEAELVAVIGKRAKHVSREEAPSVVFGFTCGNDVTARDWQFRTPQWMLGKSFDGHAPIGPWIVTADEIGDPHALAISCAVNGETRQNSNTSNLVFDVWAQIAEVSQVMTLMPGDLIFTGTPGGVGVAMKPPLFLKAGDRVRVEIEKIGALDAVCFAEG
jgi:ureidoglycolate lyase